MILLQWAVVATNVVSALPVPSHLAKDDEEVYLYIYIHTWPVGSNVDSIWLTLGLDVLKAPNFHQTTPRTSRSRI